MVLRGSDVNDSVMLLIDHQAVFFQTVSDMPMPEYARSRRGVGEDGDVSENAGRTTASRTAKVERPADPGSR